jgi:hypothetical protein
MIVVQPPSDNYLDDAGEAEAPPVHLSAYLHMIGIGEDPAAKKKKVGGWRLRGVPWRWGSAALPRNRELTSGVWEYHVGRRLRHHGRAEVSRSV